MRNIFSYDSKLTQVLSFIADLFITNMIFLLCCLPIITIGPAQAALYSAMRVRQDMNDGRSAIKVFFQAFKNGFGAISLASTLFLLADVILLYTMLMAFSYADTGVFIHWAFPAIVLAVSLTIHSLLPAFHSQFSCTAGELVRNGFMMLFTHPVRSVAVGVLTWLPMALFLYLPQVWLQLGALFFTIYYSVAFLFCVLLMQKPFKLLINNLNKNAEEMK